LQDCIVVVGAKDKRAFAGRDPEEWRKDGVEPGSKKPYTLTQRSAWLFQLDPKIASPGIGKPIGAYPRDHWLICAARSRELGTSLDRCGIVAQDPVWQEALATCWLHHEQASSWQTSPRAGICSQAIASERFYKKFWFLICKSARIYWKMTTLLPLCFVPPTKPGVMN